MKPLKIKKILVPIDFSATSMKAFDYAVFMARLNKAEITLVHVVENSYATIAPMGFDYNPIVNDVAKNENNILVKSNELLEKLAEETKKKGALDVKVLALLGRTHKQIVKAAKKIKADIIIMGTHGTSGVREFVMGSNAYRIVTDAECPVLTIRKHSKKPEFKNILVSFRDKPHSREKIKPAIAIAEMYGSKVHLLGIDTQNSKSHLKLIKAEAAQSKGIIEKHNIICTEHVMSAEYSSDTVMTYAKSVDADLIVIMADSDKMSFSEFIIGPYAKQIINHSPIPVLSVRPAFNPDLAGAHVAGANW